MKDFDDLLRSLANFPSTNAVAMDLAHVALIVSVVLAKKPDAVLELGVGSGGLTRALLAAIRYNQKGALTSVDNFCDWGGTKPSHIEDLESAGARIVEADEGAFLADASPNQFDIIISDGDHVNALFHIERVFAVARENAVLFFHDTNNPDHARLSKIEPLVRAAGIPSYHFTEISRPDERTDRGLLAVVKVKGRNPKLNLRSKLYYLAKTARRTVFASD